MNEQTARDSPRDSDGPALGGLTALVVGGSGGIGAAVSRGLAAAGASVRVHGGDRTRTETFVRQLNGEDLSGGGVEATAVVHRFDPGESVDSSLDLLIGSREPDLVVVAYGPFLEQPLLRTTEDQWRTLFETNVMLPVALGRRCLPVMMERGFGRFLVFGGSGTDRIAGYQQVSAYSAVKTALMSWVKSAARGTEGTNVVVAGLCPGYVQTEYLDAATVQRYTRLSGGRMDQPEDVARLALKILDPAQSLLNGAVIPIDGGRRG